MGFGKPGHGLIFYSLPQRRKEGIKVIHFNPMWLLHSLMLCGMVIGMADNVFLKSIGCLSREKGALG